MDILGLDSLLSEIMPNEVALKERYDAQRGFGKLEQYVSTNVSQSPMIYYYIVNDNLNVEINNSPSHVKNEVLRRSTPPSFYAEIEGVKKWLCLQRHVRFVPHHPHMHTYVEINYMYAGSCVNIVDGQEIEMKAGDFLFMKPGSVHSVPGASADDIMLNIILMPHAAGAILDKTLIGANDLSAFLIEALFSDTTKPNHLFLKTRGTESIQNAMARLMCEYFDPDNIASEVLTESYLRVVFALLLRESTLYPNKAIYARNQNSMVANIISYIHDNCIDCTRDSVSEHIGYTSNYISNLLAEHTGKSFVTIRNDFRMERAEKLLSSSDISVREIAEQCGFTNITQFYKVYREYFGRLPRR